jgi:hypothetical protein
MSNRGWKIEERLIGNQEYGISRRRRSIDINDCSFNPINHC